MHNHPDAGLDQNYDSFGLNVNVSLRLRFFAGAIYQFLNCTYKTITFECLQSSFHEEVLTEKFGKYIFVFWHKHIALPTSFFRTMPHKVLTSKSWDGELISRIMFRFGSHFVRGSSSTGTKDKGGGMALRTLMLGSKNGYNLVITPDGPKGPAKEVKMGVIKLASITGCKILPLGFAVKKSFELPTWDRTIIPLPFSKLILNYGDPISIPRRLKSFELEKYRDEIQRGMKRSNLLAESSLKKNEKI